MISIPIYSRDSTGRVRQWQYEVDGGRWRSISGLIDGGKVEAGWTICTPKNVGRSNETTPEAQAVFEADAEQTKKLDRDYRRTIPELAGVPPSPMLAQDYAKQKKRGVEFYSQPKLDGIRALISRHGAFSRQYQRHLNVDHIEQALAPLFAQFPNLILDGELYNHDFKDNFNQISSIVRKQKPKPADRDAARDLIQFHVYDAINGTPDTLCDYEDRYAFLETEVLGLELDGSPIRVVETLYTISQEEIDAAYATYMEAGFEGQMLRDPKGYYEIDKRSKTLLKRKEFLDGEFEVAAILEGNGNWGGYAKGVVFLMPDGRKTALGENPKAGIRGSQEFAKQLLENAATYVGGQVTIRYFTPTPDGIPRFPVAVDFHPHGRKD